MPADHDRVETLFNRALGLPLGDRVAFLAAGCGDDAELRARVERLLAAHDELGESIAPAPSAGSSTATFGPDADEPTADYPGRDEHAGAVIGGKYALVEPIGEGGMGSVWRAKQTEPVKRFVALKLIKAGMDSKQVLVRFEAERQALALMDHPNIAKVLDGGLHDGRPFFVMELVKGVPITDYCDAHKQTPKARLDLFGQACQAIQHAHQKGIIHRDIKPSNVLVALYDDKPVVKVIDFGVAKATGGTLTERTLDTGFGGVVGTPQYMSPEQATFNNLDIDTRSDVYALGVLLYELLSGSPPFSGKELQKKGLLEILRVVREEEPPRPSTKLSTADALPSLSANRGTEPKKLTGLLRNELDWIVMKALEKDRARRYETANGFTADVQRYLSGEPVQAHPPSMGYRIKKFVRRNRGQVIAASLVLFALLAGVIGTTLGLLEARRQTEFARGQEAEAKKQEGIARAEAEAKEAARAAEEKQRTVAQAKEKEANDERAKAQAAATAEKSARLKEAEERGYAEAVADFVRADFLALTSVEGQGRWGGEGLTRNATLKELLDRAGEKLLKRTDLSERTVGDLAWIIGVSYRNLSEYERAIKFLEVTANSRKKRLGADDPDTLEAQNSLAVAYHRSGRAADAVALHEETLKRQRAKLEPNHRATLLSMSNLAHSYQAAGRLDEAVPLFEEALKLQKSALGPTDAHTLHTMNNLGSAYHAAGRARDAVALWEQTLPLMKKFRGPEHTDTLASMNNLAGGYFAVGRAGAAVPLLEETLKLRKAILEPDHPDTLATMSNLAWAYRDTGKLALALPLFEDTFKLMRVRPGPDHPDTLHSMYGLASGYRAAGRQDLAIPLFEDALKRMKAKLPVNDARTLECMNGLAGSYRDAGKLDLALPLFEQTVELMKGKVGPDSAETLNVMTGVAASYWSLQRFDKSVPLFEEILRLQEKKLGRADPGTQGTVANLGVNYKDAGRFKEAISLLEEAYNGGVAWAGEPLMEAYARGGKPAEAVTLQEALLKSSREALPKESAALARILVKCAILRLELKQYAEAEPLLRESLAIALKAETDEWRTFGTQALLGAALLGLKKYADAEPLLVTGYEGMKAREKSIPLPLAARLPDALDRLIELSTATNKPDEGEEVARRTREVPEHRPDAARGEALTRAPCRDTIPASLGVPA